jgi:cell wall-associated NlpC family hydrolase
MIRKFIKYTVSAAILATMIQATPAFATPDDSQVTQEQITETQEKIQEFETKIQQLDDRIIVSMDKSQKLNDQIKVQQEKIEEAEAEIEKSQQDLAAHEEILAERLKSLQLDGQQSVVAYAEILLSSGSLSEFFNRFTAISQIIQSDTDLMSGLKEKQEALTAAEDQLHKELEQLKKNQDELASEQRKIEEDKREIESELAATESLLQSQEAKLAQQALEAQRALEAQQALEAQAQQSQQSQEAPQTEETQQVQQATSSESKTTKSVQTASVAAVSTTNSGDASQVIAYAKQFLGVPYVWGGSTPRGFDCSGFVQYVYRNSVGTSLPRVSRDQQNAGTRISPSQVQPGDLVFNGSPAYHVGIYIGGGQYIHAPQTGDVVKIAAYNPSRFSSAARVLR